MTPIDDIHTLNDDEIDHVGTESHDADFDYLDMDARR